MLATDVLRGSALPLTGAPGDYDPIAEAAREARFVLIGEASHGTHEFYDERAAITRRLIERDGFHAVAVEADWPDAYRVNSYLRGTGGDTTADGALGGFRRFPTWMWRNRVVETFVEWLRARNAWVTAERQVGFYGLDLYSLHTSIAAVLDYLERTDPVEARKARQRYACFELFGNDAQAYGYTAVRNPDVSCEESVARQLESLEQRARAYASADGVTAVDAYFYAEQNARLVKNAEAYYRSMYAGRASSWNLRDRHMCETLYALRDHLLAQGIDEPRIVVWAHNSHLGDARATEMQDWGELNLGQLVREREGRRAVLVGFTTFTGTVSAATDWDAPVRLRRVVPGLAESYERLLHDVGVPHFLLALHDPDIADALQGPKLERAIGVIYRPETERSSHYFEARLSEQFDFVIHTDETRAVEPLERGTTWTVDEPPETYPTGL